MKSEQRQREYSKTRFYISPDASCLMTINLQDCNEAETLSSVRKAHARGIRAECRN